MANANPTEDQVDDDLHSLFGAASKNLTSLKALQRKRRGKRISARKTVNTLQTHISTLSSAMQTKIKLKDLLDELKQYDTSIHDLISTSDKFDVDQYQADVDLCDEYTDLVGVALAQTDLELGTLRAAQNVSNQGRVNNPLGFNSQMHAPKVELPKFDGKKMNYPRFILEFDDIISQTNFTEYQKFNCLYSHVDELSQGLLKSNGMHKMTYSDGRAILDMANDDVKQSFEVVKGLSEIRFSAREPYRWLSRAKSLREVMNHLQMDAESFMLYFLWNSLPHYFQDQLIALTGETQPSVNEILGKKFFEATTRTEHVRSQSQNSPQQTVAMTTGGSETPKNKSNSHSRKPPPCVYCESDRHVSSKCPKYTTPSTRIQRLKSLKRCEKCTGAHETSYCDYFFKYKCSKCKQKHFSNLCMQANKGNSQTNAATVSGAQANASPSQSNSATQEISTSQISSSVILTVSSDDDEVTQSNVIMPSFTATIQSPLGISTEVRCWKDTCSQNSFVEERFSKDFKFEVLNEVELSLKGINGVQTYQTRKVKVPLNINGTVHEIIATELAGINISLHIPDLEEVVGGFSNRGFVLADKHLRSSPIADGRLLLGSAHSHLIPIATKTFGTASYLESPLGVMLEGDAQNIIDNLPNLTNNH